MGRLLSMSGVTAKVVAPARGEAEASEPAPIGTHDHDVFQANQIGGARQSGRSPHMNEPDFTSPARLYFARMTPLGDALLSISSKPA